MTIGTTKTSGWAVFWFLLGFTVLGTGFAGTGMLGLIGGGAILILSAVVFKQARKEEGT